MQAMHAEHKDQLKIAMKMKKKNNNNNIEADEQIKHAFYH